MKEVLAKRIKILETAETTPFLRDIELEACRRDVLYFFDNYLYTDRNTNLFTGDEASKIPFIPFDFQRELITEIRKSIISGTKPIDKREDLTNVFIEKSRQMGVSWIVMGIFLYGFLFHNHKYLVISQKEEDVDKIGDMKSLFEKIRFMIRELPNWMIPEGFHKSPGTEFNKYKSMSKLNGTGSITGESANPNASRGGTYQAIFMDEMAFMQNATTINAAASAATPCRIFNSTPNGEGNEFYRMRKLTMERKDDEGNLLQPDIKGLRYHWSDHPLYDTKRYEWKIRGMSKEKVAQELEIDYNTAVVGRVYDNFPTKHVTLEYKIDKPMYVWMDNSHGGQDPNAIIVMQPDGVYWNVIDSIEISQPPEYCAEYLTEQPRFTMNYEQEKFLERRKTYNRRKAIFVSDPYDTKSMLGSSTILDDYKKAGINLFLPQERSKKEQIMKTRTNIYRLRYNQNCLDFASAILNARYPERKDTSNSTTSNDLPVHNRTSHYRTALEYGATYILENPMVERERVRKDTRPRRNMVTGELIYS